MIPEEVVKCPPSRGTDARDYPRRPSGRASVWRRRWDALIPAAFRVEAAELRPVSGFGREPCGSRKSPWAKLSPYRRRGTFYIFSRSRRGRAGFFQCRTLGCIWRSAINEIRTHPAAICRKHTYRRSVAKQSRMLPGGQLVERPWWPTPTSRSRAARARQVCGSEITARRSRGRYPSVGDSQEQAVEHELEQFYVICIGHPNLIAFDAPRMTEIVESLAAPRCALSDWSLGDRS